MKTCHGSPFCVLLAAVLWCLEKQWNVRILILVKYVLVKSRV